MKWIREAVFLSGKYEYVIWVYFPSAGEVTTTLLIFFPKGVFSEKERKETLVLSAKIEFYQRFVVKIIVRRSGSLAWLLMVGIVYLLII